MKNRKSKWIGGCIVLCVLIITIFVFIFRETILFKAGSFLAPSGDYKADVAILEGNEFVSTGIITKGMHLLSSGKVKRIVIVLQSIAPADRPYGLEESYPDIVRQKIKNLGLKKQDFKIIMVPVQHPITLKEAEVVLKNLSRENIKSAILLSSGFHTRRSYLVYQYIGKPLQIKIFPEASFTGYNLDNWLVQERGFRDFTVELFKLVYYLAGGYIPFKFSYQ
ncbi:MAG: hypothetical protein LLG40_12845 [Deltaproteobacteria bacterium]|nr:hypothetical protein [Deltaproteobacteria bacterium]